MTGPVTIPTKADVTAFIDAVEPQAKRDDARILDSLFRRISGHEPKMWGPSIIGYGAYRTVSATGRKVEWLRTGFSPRKAKHSLYLMGGYCDSETGERLEDLLARLGKHTRGKSCLYINRLSDVDIAVLEELLADDWATMLRRYPD